MTTLPHRKGPELRKASGSFCKPESMTPEERKRLHEIYEQIATEEDPVIFNKLLRELNKLLDQENERIHPDHTVN